MLSDYGMGDTRYKLPGSGVTEGGPATDYVAFIFVSVVTLPVDLHKEHFLLRPSHPKTDIQSFRFSVKIFSRSVLHGNQNFFLPKSEGVFR
jgi:hypothetical protein